MNVTSVVKDLENLGISIIPNYFSSEQCDSIKDSFISNVRVHESKVFVNESEGMGGDSRLFSFEKANSLAKDFLFDKEIIEILSTYSKKKDESFKQIIPCNCLAGHLQSIPGKVTNSGGDWHVDSLKLQVKAILYLSDTGINNGPFSYIPNLKPENINQGFVKKILNFSSNPRRFDDKTIRKLSKEIMSITGKKGTLILVDTSNVHRGEPIVEGERFSLTNYYMYTQSSCLDFKKKISINSL